MVCPPFPNDFRVTEIPRDRRGVLVRTPREFVATAARLASDESERKRLGKAAGSAGQSLDWDMLTARYEREVLDVHLL